jgi:hypothetical protein
MSELVSVSVCLCVLDCVRQRRSLDVTTSTVGLLTPRRRKKTEASVPAGGAGSMSWGPLWTPHRHTYRRGDRTVIVFLASS